MQYLLTEDEYQNAIPRKAVAPFLKATADYYDLKNKHLMRCLQEADRMGSGLSANPLDGAVARHRREWTELPPKPEDFFK